MSLRTHHRDSCLHLQFVTLIPLKQQSSSWVLLEREKDPFLFPVVGSWPGFVDSVPLCKQSISERKHITSTDSSPGFVSTDTVRIVHLSISFLSKWQTALFICRCTPRPIDLTTICPPLFFWFSSIPSPIISRSRFSHKIITGPCTSVLSEKHQYSWLLARHLALK